jgi:hypothetical protein
LPNSNSKSPLNASLLVLSNDSNAHPHDTYNLNKVIIYHFHKIILKVHYVKNNLFISILPLPTSSFLQPPPPINLNKQPINLSKSTTTIFITTIITY